MVKTRIRFFCYVVGVLLTLPRNGAAQLGRIKEKLTQKAKDPASAQQPANADVQEITRPVLEGLLRGLRTEVALRKEFRDLLAKYPTREEYDACQSQAAASPEFQKLLLSLNIPENASPEEGKRIVAKHQEDLAALLKRRCPLDPNEWTPARKAERLRLIEQQAAEAAAPVQPPSGESELEPAASRGPSVGFAHVVPQGVSVDAYRILQERIPPLCNWAKGRARPDPSKPISIPGSGRNTYWVFTGEEAVLLYDRCD